MSSLISIIATVKKRILDVEHWELCTNCSCWKWTTCQCFYFASLEWWNTPTPASVHLNACSYEGWGPEQMVLDKAAGGVWCPRAASLTHSDRGTWCSFRVTTWCNGASHLTTCAWLAPAVRWSGTPFPLPVSLPGSWSSSSIHNMWSVIVHFVTFDYRPFEVLGKMSWGLI